MAEPDKDLQTLLEDVKTIKAILQNEDAALPPVWRLTWVVAPVLMILALVQYFVPFYRGLGFDGVVLWLWLPTFSVMFPLLLAYLLREVNRTGKRFLVQGRIRHLLFARFVFPPAGLAIVWAASRNPEFPVEGTVLLVISLWQTTIEQMLPPSFRWFPFLFLGAGLVELVLRLGGPEVTLFNVALVAATLVSAGFLLRAQNRKPAGGQ